jgi:adenine-specific DNA-methyltransferase
MAKKKNQHPTTAAAVKSYKHRAKRVHIPTQEESVRLSARDKQPVKKKYNYDPSLDPQLLWTGKSEQGKEMEISTVPIYVQEHVAPEALIARLKSGSSEEAQMMLFGETAETQLADAIDFYKHEENWKNRMILGDSLIVMNSLLEKEGMRGRIQTVYVDPPYGIKFGSNWQVSTKKRDVKDNKVEDFIRQPEQVKAFRDTWELGVHSYLSYLRDRLITARELLTESGSCFVQISDENMHLIRNLMDEVFGSQNYCRIISFSKTAGLGTKLFPVTQDYIIWYAKDIEQVKYRQLYLSKVNEESEEFGMYQKVDEGGRYRIDNLTSQNNNVQSCLYEYEFNGGKYRPGPNNQWKTTIEGMDRLKSANRLVASAKGLYYKRYLADFPVRPLTDNWNDTGSGGFSDEKIYVVQTNMKVIQRCLLMTTDPGDIVLDPTCGSGTTAHVAEQWGRRWITSDTSRVALALARTRLMTAKFPYFKLKENGDEAKSNVAAGFLYKTVPHITLRSIATGEDSDRESLYDQPEENKDAVRVSGPFTVESLSPHRVSDAQEMISSERFVEIVIENLRKSGVQTGDKGARVEFTNLDILPGGPEVQASGEYQTTDGPKRVAVAIGPEFGSVDDDFIRDAARVAKKFSDLLIVAGTSFDASAFAEKDQDGTLRIMRVKINPDLSMGDLLKKTGSGNLFIAFGEPDIKVREEKSGLIVDILGVDIYDPVKSEVRSSGAGNLEHDIAAWFIDTNYSGQAFFVTQAYFLGADKPYEKLKRALKADISEEAWEELYSTTSRPFPKPKTGKIAVKVINHYGDEVMKVIEI